MWGVDTFSQLPGAKECFLSGFCLSAVFGSFFWGGELLLRFQCSLDWSKQEQLVFPKNMTWFLFCFMFISQKHNRLKTMATGSKRGEKPSKQIPKAKEISNQTSAGPCWGSELNNQRIICFRSTESVLRCLWGGKKTNQLQCVGIHVLETSIYFITSSFCFLHHCASSFQSNFLQTADLSPCCGCWWETR